jgi:hypothetical protein
MAVGLCLALVAPIASAAPAAPVAFECEMSVRTTSHGVVERMKLTTKGDYRHVQMRTGAGLKILFIRNRQGMYHLNMHTNDGAKYPPSWVKAFERRLMTPGPQGDPWVFLKSVQAKKTGRQTVNGRAAEVWTYSLPMKTGKSQVVRVYMDTKERRPVKADLRMPISRDRIDTVVIEYSKYRWGFPLADSFFNLPRGAKIVDLPEEEKPNALPGGPAPSEKPAGSKRASNQGGARP